MACRTIGATLLLACVALPIRAGQGAPGSAAAPGPGQDSPGRTAQIFAPGIVNAGLPARDVAITPDGRELYFSVYLPGFVHAAILVTRREDGRWTTPEVAPFATDSRFRFLEPCISPDGQRLLFASDRPADPLATAPGPFGIWVMDRAPSGWTTPRRLGPAVNAGGPTFFPSLTLDGTLYFTRDEKGGTSAIYRSRSKNGELQPAERLPAAVNCAPSCFNAFVAANESYVIVPAYGRDDSRGGTDYYVVFRREPERWSQPVNLGDAINTPENDEYSPYVTRDGRHFFFMSVRETAPRIAPSEPLSLGALQALNQRLRARVPGIYWMEAGFIEELRQTAVFP